MSRPSYMSTKKLVRVCMIAFVVASGGGVVAAQSQIDVEPLASEAEGQASPGMEPPASEVEGQALPDADPQAIVHEDLGRSPNAVDVWSLQCGPGTVYARADVNNLGVPNGVGLRVTLVNPLGRAATQMAPDNGPSPLATIATLKTGPGNYLVIITKLQLGPLPITVEPYVSRQICTDALGNLTRESVQLIQDQ